MTDFLQVAGLDAADFGDRGISLAMGMFDGVHIGHTRVFESAIQESRSKGTLPGALVFWPHPSHLFHPESPTPMISTPEMKRQVMEEQGLGFVIEEPFTAAFASIEADRFMQLLKEKLPNLVSVHVGENWRFGKQRKGDAALLRRLASEVGVDARIIGSVEMGADRVSSTRIREALVDGRVEDANEMLGRPYGITNTVQEGRRLGRQIGIPTLNLAFPSELVPKLGVYVGEVWGQNRADEYPAIFNLGVRPTVGGNLDEAPLLEAHLLSKECPFSYGDKISVAFKSFIRPELKFDSVDSLRTQIQSDIGKARNYFGLDSNG